MVYFPYSSLSSRRKPSREIGHPALVICVADLATAPPESNTYGIVFIGSICQDVVPSQPRQSTTRMILYNASLEGTFAWNEVFIIPRGDIEGDGNWAEDSADSPGSLP